MLCNLYSLNFIFTLLNNKITFKMFLNSDSKPKSFLKPCFLEPCSSPPPSCMGSHMFNRLSKFSSTEVSLFYLPPLVWLSSFLQSPKSTIFNTPFLAHISWSLFSRFVYHILLPNILTIISYLHGLAILLSSISDSMNFRNSYTSNFLFSIVNPPVI